MRKHYFIFTVLVCMAVESAMAESVECRIATSGTRECNPYTKKFLQTKEVTYEIDRKKLIVDKTLPVPEKKKFIKIVFVADMIEKYVDVHDSVRFKGSEELRREREERIVEIRKREEAKKKLEIVRLSEEKRKALEARKKAIEAEKLAKEKELQGTYKVVKGDSLSAVAKKFGVKKSELRELNRLKKRGFLRIGQKLTLPLEQKRIDTIVSGEYIVQKGDTLASVAKDFALKKYKLSLYNGMKKNAKLQAGMKLRLPLPHKLAEVEKRKMLKSYGKRKLRVTATAYTSHSKQTDRTPFLAAWNNRLRPGMRAIAVSRDLLTKYGLRNGTRVRIAGLPGTYRVMDKMNKRFKRRIDIYMGLDRRRALRWGRRSVVIHW